ncbi:MAG: phospholipase/carboxylesterase [Candidatus Eremiobacteraeota bacterium]|nr:phospholipase/carboxylesterase [Candidatus Eremiobacteraeota bacterium]
MTSPESARLRARPAPPSAAPLPPGDHRLGIGRERDVVLVVPESYDAARPAPLVVGLHGAGGNAARRIERLRPHAERIGALLLAPDSVGATWDVIRGGLGPDVRRIGAGLAFAFARFAVDPARIAIEGFSDGASYALTLGLPNGDLFRRIFAFSPGFMAPPELVGAPSVFVSHGTHDPVLPVACSRRIVPQLRRLGLSVDYREFDGEHVAPDELVRAAFDSL